MDDNTVVVPQVKTMAVPDDEVDIESHFSSSYLFCCLILFSEW
uniref:Uncharacterized protein n=1 Tax=Arundo donax TaxID=35708 RepID=A0A0A8ZQQ6_ARUDO